MGRTVASALILVAIVSLAACGGGGSDNRTLQAANPRLARLVPDSYRDSGHIRGASSFAGPPMYYYEAGDEPAGMVVEQVELAASKLGLAVRWSQVPYEGIKPALDTGRMDVSGSQFSPTPANLSQVIGVAPWEVSDSIVVKKGNPLGIRKVDDLCGHSIGFTAAALPEATAARTVAQRCEQRGLAPVKEVPMKDASSERVALDSGRIDTMLAGYLSARYLAEKGKNEFDVVLPSVFARRASGVVVGKDNLALAEALAAGFEEAMKDGSYHTLMEKWGDTSNESDRVYLNDPGPEFPIIDEPS